MRTWIFAWAARALLLFCSLVPAQGFASAWFPARVPVRGVALMIHGLNLKPRKMDQLASVLAASGVEVFRLELSGHGKEGQAGEVEFAGVTAADWTKEALEGYRATSEKARALRVPHYFVGFSIGGLLGQELLNREKSGTAFERVLLLAPALSVRPLAYLIKPLFFLGNGFVLGSANDPAYRANPGTPMAAYRATFDLLGEVSRDGFKRSNIPTLVLIDPDDEFVRLSGIERIVQEHALTEWRIVKVSAENTLLSKKRHHLIVDEPAVGPSEWARMKEEIVRHLALKPRSSD